MQQLQQERLLRSEIIQPILDQILDEVVAVLGSEVQPPVSCSETPDTPDSPAYRPPEIESEDEAFVSAEAGESVSYECTECQLREENIYEIMMHLEVDHGLPDDEDILREKVRKIKTQLPVQENNNENM